VNWYEPRLALDGGEDGLDIIRQLFAQAQARLNSGGGLLVEIGATQGQTVAQLASRFFCQANLQIKKDLAGLDRLLVVETIRPGSACG
jgi:release factor glutamine methyltransferase